MVLRGLKDRGFHGEADAIVFYDLATDYLDVLPVQSRSRSNTLEAFRRFAGGQTLKLVYSDQAPELKNAVTTLGALHRLDLDEVPLFLLGGQGSSDTRLFNLYLICGNKVRFVTTLGFRPLVLGMPGVDSLHHPSQACSWAID